MTGKQRARMADLSLLLDIVLKTSSQTIKKEFVVCGILNQLQQAIGRNFSREYRCETRKRCEARGRCETQGTCEAWRRCEAWGMLESRLGNISPFSVK